MIAGIPNIEKWVESSSIVRPQSYPSDSSSTQDFIDRLFRDGQWQTATPGIISVTPLPSNPSCTLKRVTAINEPEFFISTSAGGGYLYPGAINQGKYINMGVGALEPIHIDYTKRNPVYLSADFFQEEVSPIATLSSVNAAIGRLIKKAPPQTPADVITRIIEASSLTEAAHAMNTDAKMLGLEAGSQININITERQNTVFVFFMQQLFSVHADLRNQRPVRALFNDNLTVGDLEDLGSRNEIGYENLPTYVESVTYGRIMIFSMSSKASLAELSYAANAKFGNNGGGNTSDRVNRIIQESKIQVFSRGGPFEPVEQSIKDGSYKSYFNSTNIDRALAKPIGYSVRLWNDRPGPMFRTTEYTSRNCAPIHNIEVELSEVYKSASVYAKHENGGAERHITTTDDRTTANITDALSDKDDYIRISNQGGRKGFPPNWQRRVRVRVLVDGEEKFNNKRECNWCNSIDNAFCLRVNRSTGSVRDNESPCP